ncbi:MAG: HAMP domain-containing histidine kinase [Clostridia bacterium]|nr:HAMP domain-containing histidine kinase [Clostridia bacterium]
MPKEKKTISFSGIIPRWFKSVFAVTTVALLIIGIALAATISSVYHSSVQKSAAESADEFNSLSSVTTKNFKSAAVDLCESFGEKNIIEVHVLDQNGKAFVSTTGFEPDKRDETKNFEKALNDQKGVYITREKTSDGERILTGTNIIKSKSGKAMGAYVWTVSLRATRRYINFIYAIIFVVFICIFLLYAVMGIRFLRSIATPIREVGITARKIAHGDFAARITKERDDEIGDLCETVNYMASELENAENIKNDFIQSVSHELRTPLTAIRGWGETAKMAVGTDEELVSRGLDVVLSEADRLSGLVEELLDFSRMQQGRLTVNTAPIDISNLLESVTAMYSELAKKQGIEISFTPPTAVTMVEGDRDRLKQVFINVLDNAVKYTEKGGLILITQTEDKGCVQIQFKDTGAGIAAKDIEHVKEKFYKANQTVRGSGIGLAVADEIIKQHNGLLLIDSVEGVGTTVSVVLPIIEEAEETTETALSEVLPEVDAKENAEWQNTQE